MEPHELIKKARNDKGWSQETLGKKVGISQPAVRKIEAGDTQQSKHLAAIAQVLGLPLSQVMPDQGIADFDQASAYGAVADFPIHAAAEGGQGTIIVSSEPVDYIRRPAEFSRVKDAFGVLIVGSSMEPEFKQGETAIVVKHMPVVNDEVHIFYSEREGEGRATIKHLRKQTPDKWLVTQHNPAKDFTLSREEWQWAYRVMGKLARR